MASPRSVAGSNDKESEGEETEESFQFNNIQVAKNALEMLNLQGDHQKSETDGELELFRQQWQRELDGTPVRQLEPHKMKQPELLTDEDRAKQLFLCGVEMERAGKLYEAIQYYKRAMQLMPDVERHLYESSELRADTPEEEPKVVEVERREVEADSDDENAVEGEDLLIRLQRIITNKGLFCEPEYPTKGAHMSCLPHEVMLVVLRWVVSAELDAASLERVAAASRGLYVLARDPALWRSLCLRTWGTECGGARAYGGSWRRMYLVRPRLLLHGCYISKTSYLRPGELSFQDHCCRPWHLVDYYRYLRFFHDGLVLMWTTAEEPATCVGQLKLRQPRPALGVLVGHYRLIGDKVVIVLKKTNSEKKLVQTSTRFRSRRKDSFEQHEQTFHLELQLRDVRWRRNWQLSWRRYAVWGREQWTQFDLAPNKFPAFAFSRVRTYTAEAAAPLPAH
ncbi:hypothetical protein ACJJTC_004869 [Scirpophaga incertulas]